MAMEKWNDADERIQKLINNNRLVINELLDFIISATEQRQRFGKSVVGISGAGCLGKSTLAQAMAVCFKDEYHIPTIVVDLDGFLIEKAVRESAPIPISGYHPRGYELQAAQAVLKKLIELDMSIEIKVYDKVSSQRKTTRVVHPERIVIIEGACAFFDELRDFSDIKIFVDAAKDVQFKNRWRRETFEMDRTMEQIATKFDGLYPDYLQYIKPMKAFADVILSVDTRYQFHIEKMISL